MKTTPSATSRLGVSDLRRNKSSDEVDLEINSTVFKLAVCAMMLAIGFLIGQKLG